jgi:hypothetical protein
MLGLARIVWRLRPRGRRQILLIAAALFFCYRAASYGDPLSAFCWQYAAIGVWIACRRHLAIRHRLHAVRHLRTDRRLASAKTRGDSW